MYVIVIGGGKVGYFLSRDLAERGDEVTLVEKDSARADWLESQLGSIVVRGDGDEMALLQTTGVERADAVLAVTGDDEDNLVALQLAKQAFNVRLTIARVNNPANVQIFKQLGVDQAVSATEILLRAIEPELEESGSNAELGAELERLRRAPEAGTGPARAARPASGRGPWLHRTGTASDEDGSGVPAAPSNDRCDQAAFPILKIFVPHTGHTPCVAGLPFFIVIDSASLISRLVLHFMQ